MALAGEYLAATEGARAELVLLHGWGCDREIWRPLLTFLRPWANLSLFDLPCCAPSAGGAADMDLQQLLDEVLAASPGRAVYLGWSLGGKLALELAARHPARVAGVVTVCANPSFLAREDWPGMEPGEFARFRAGVAANPVAGLRRFDSLQTAGARAPRSLLRQLRACRRRRAGSELERGLQWLVQLDQRTLLQGLQQPQLHLLAERDELVPATVADPLRDLLDGDTARGVVIIEGASHVAPLDSAGPLAARLWGFLGPAGLLGPPTPGDDAPAKKDVAASFSRSASRYDSVATLQRNVGEQVLARSGPGQSGVDTVLDLGCGTGHFRESLARRFPGARYIGLDLAPGMVQYARRRSAGDSAWLVGDAESLPLAAATVDLVFSSLAIQWCHRPQQVFAEMARVLKPGGRAIFSSLGPATLRELRAAWAAVDEHRHVNTFLPTAALELAAGSVPGITLSLATEEHRMEYQRVGELLAELKTLGAHNMNRDRPTGLTSRRTLQGMLAAYEDWRQDGVLPATYEVVFGEVKRL